jgi:aspartyl-tRNA(Asn)/glutamyl-tRNA(Gln) amidotransferase subunit A
MTDAHELSIAQLVSAYRDGALRPAEVAAGAIRRINAFDGSLNAFVETRPDAVEEAAAGRGPLAGVPVALKDVFGFDGRVPTMGSRVHAEWVRETAEVVTRLRAAGAAIIGFTNLHEWAIGTTSIETARGPIRNPWDTDHVAGGSSGGSAVALAAGFVPAAIGTDRGGSVRVPAACCGVVGLKPTWGLVPTSGYAGDGNQIDHVGPMARKVADVRTLLEILAPGDYDAPEVRGLTVGVPSNYFFDDVEPAIAAVIENVIALIDPLVARVVPVEVAGVEGSRLAASVLALPDVAEQLGDALKERHDELQPETAQVLMLGAQMSDEDRAQGESTRQAIVAGWADAFSEVDVVITPTLPGPPALVSEKTVELPSGIASADLSYIGLNAPMNLGGVPCLSLPCGETSEGWTVSASLSAARGGDGLVLALGDAIEAALDGAYANRVVSLQE